MDFGRELSWREFNVTLKNPNKQTHVLSAAWENINIATKCRCWVNLFLYPASCQPASWLRLTGVYLSPEQRVCNALLKEKGDLPCSSETRSFLLEYQLWFPTKGLRGLSIRQPVPKPRHQELPSSTRCWEPCVLCLPEERALSRRFYITSYVSRGE